MKFKNKFIFTILLFLVCILFASNITYASSSTIDYTNNGQDMSIEYPFDTSLYNYFVCYTNTSRQTYLRVFYFSKSLNYHFVFDNYYNGAGNFDGVRISVADENNNFQSFELYSSYGSSWEHYTYNNSYIFVYAYELNDYDFQVYENTDSNTIDNTDLQVFWGAGANSGESGDGNTNSIVDELQNPYGSYQLNSDDDDDTNYFGDDYEDSTGTSWFSSLINWLLTPFKYFAKILTKIWNFFKDFFTKLLAGLFDFIKYIFVPDTDELIFDDVKETIYNKFAFIGSFSQIQSDFQNVFDNESECPTFYITLPQFLGGSQVSPIDFRFYNQYRSVIHGFIIAVSYFFFIKKTFFKIPKIVKGE